MEERNYDAVDQNALTVTITLAEYRHLLKRDLEANAAQNCIWKKNSRISKLEAEKESLKKNVQVLENKLTYILNMRIIADKEQDENDE